MKIIKKRISAVLLSVYMVFGVVSSDYLTVQAFEWVVPSLTVGESLLWLMGLLGMTYTEGASAWRDVSPEYEQEFIDYANEHGLTYTETSTWLNDTASGKLNQLSEVWTNFKEWVKSLVSSNADAGSLAAILGDDVRDVGIYNYLNSFMNQSIFDFNNFKGAVSDSYVYNGKYSRTISFVETSYDDYILTDNKYISRRGNLSFNALSIRVSVDSDGSFASYSSDGRVETTYFDVMVGTFNPSLYHFYLGSNDTTDSAFDTYNPALIPDINFADANTEDASIPGVIDLPWGNLGDDAEERDKTYDDLVGGLDLGQELGDLWQALQDLMGVLAVDDAGVLQPNSGGENPPTLEDEAENNKVNGAFVLTGLQKVFPFCIPFDLYAFITLLEAPPVAPVIRYPIYNPVTKSNEIIIIDFSTWESVVILFRYIFDFLFIIGLLLMARALIGGGDSA